MSKKKSVTQEYVEQIQLAKDSVEENEIRLKGLTLKLDPFYHAQINAVCTELGVSKLHFCSELLRRNVFEAGVLLGVIDPDTGLSKNKEGK